MSARRSFLGSRRSASIRGFTGFPLQRLFCSDRVFGPQQGHVQFQPFGVGELLNLSGNHLRLCQICKRLLAMLDQLSTLVRDLPGYSIVVQGIIGKVLDPLGVTVTVNREGGVEAVPSQ